MNLGLRQNIVHTGRQEFSNVYPFIASIICKATPSKAVEHLDAQNGVLSKEKMVELTYGPKKPQVKSFVPEYVKLDNKVLNFEGVVRDKVQDWWTEKYRIHFVNVLYYLENDTIKVIEPEVPNSGLYQGTMFKRDRYLNPNANRNYHWKDFNIGNQINLFGRTIHIYDCDRWTREFLTEEGIEVNEPEPKPENPILLEREAMKRRNEPHKPVTDTQQSSSRFLVNDGKVLQFYGILKDDTASEMEIRRIVLNFYLSDGTLDVTENWKPNSGRGPTLPPGRKVLDNIPINLGKCIWMTIIKKQRILKNRDKDVDKLPCYLQPRDEDDVVWLTPKDLTTGQDIKILGMTFFFNKCNEFTQEFYRNHYGIDMPQVEIVPKPKIHTPILVPPFEFGHWEEGLRDCFKPYENLKTKVKKFHMKPQEVTDTVLRFSAILDTARETEQNRVFIIFYFMEDDTVKIVEERIDNSGHPGGVFLRRCHLRKDLGRIGDLTPPLALGAKPIYYEPSDFYIGAKIRAGGSLFLITDVDLGTIKFMERHPEMYPDIDTKEQRELSDFLKGFIKPSHTERMHLLQELKDEVFKNYNSPTFPYPKTLNLGTYYQPRNVVEEELVCANLPISPKSLNKLVDSFTFKGRTDVNEIKTFLTVALGHNRCH